MSTFYGISSDSVSTLFSSLGGGNSATGNILSTYAQIRNGSYLKLAKAYYAKEETSKDKTNKNDKLSRLNAEQKAKELTEIKSNADNVIKSASEL